VLTPERSLVYDLIRFCYSNRLPLDFVSWHAFSSSPLADKEGTVYRKTGIKLIRDWLKYFRFDKNTLLVVDEWNYDRDANLLAERTDKSFIAASYLASRLKNMYEAGIDRQVYFALEDFQNNKEGVVRNVGAFYYDPEHSGYKGGAKAVFNGLRMLNLLGDELLPVKLEDSFAGAVASRSKDYLAVLVYNYIDPDTATNYLSQNISGLDSGERRFILELIKSGRLSLLLSDEQGIQGIRSSSRVKQLLRQARSLNEGAKKFQTQSRALTLAFKNLKDPYLYERYTVDSGCSLNCEFSPVESKEVAAGENYQEQLNITPYSLQLIVLKKKPEAPLAEPAKTNEGKN
jgi:hypothetical protein